MTATTGFNGFTGAPPRPRSGPPFNPARDRTITRLACLKAAAEFAAGRSEIKSKDVLLIAAAWESWVRS